MYEIVFGQRRHQACLELGLDVLAMVDEIDPEGFTQWTPPGIRATAFATNIFFIHALGDAAQYAPGDWAQAPVAGGRTLPYVMPIMNAARALAQSLNGTTTEGLPP